MTKEQELIAAALEAAEEAKNWPRHLLSQVEIKLIRAAKAYRADQEIKEKEG